MRITTVLLFIGTMMVGCGSGPELKPEAQDVTGEVQLPSGTSPKGITVSFRPTGDGMPAAAKVEANGTFTVKIIPGDYVFYFAEEANVKAAGYNSIPAKYKTPSTEHAVTVNAGKPCVISLN